MTLRRVILSMGVLLAPCLAADDVYSVCQILAHLENFSCRPVRIKARLVSDVATWLEGENCSNPVKVKNEVFQDLIALAWPITLQVGCNVGFRDDENSSQRLRAVLGRFDPRKEKERIDIMVDGVIAVRQK